MTGILEGVRVVDMGHVVAIPTAGATLADWGAEVIKVEPLTGDLLRGQRVARFVDGALEFYEGEVNWIVEVLNRGKRSLAVDLKKESGRDIMYRLVKKSDVFMSNYEVSALKNLKMDYAALSQINPGIVYAVVTGYGRVGPDKDERGFDFSASWARSGAQYLIGQPGSPPPPQRGGMMDRVAAAHIVGGILAALLRKEKTGKGQELECSLYHAGVWTLAGDIQAALMNWPLDKHDRDLAPSPLWNTYRARDDKWFQLAMLQPDLHWSDFCRAIERPELENDPRFNTLEVRAENCGELIQILDKLFAFRTLEEWEKRFRENNCIYGRVQTPMEVTTDPQAVANDFFVEIDHPVGGQMKLVTTPVKFHQDPASAKGPAPETGQHTEEILLEMDYDWEDITRFKDEGVIL